MKSGETVELTEKEIYLIKIEKIEDCTQIIRKEIEYGLIPNELIIQEIIEALIDIERGAKLWRMKN